MADEAQKIAFMARCRKELPFFGEQCLKLRTKAGEFMPLRFNKSQALLHAAVEKQREEKGWVRAVVLKGRQQGISTYTAARFYQKSSLHKGRNVYILTHEQPASDTLFGIVDRYQRSNPIQPHVGTSNAKELVFDKLDSSYAVATAGTKAGGRSKAISLFHGSEVAYWANATDHFSASVQGVPLAPGTEIILESTSAGSGGIFYEKYLDAEAGRGDYIAVFLPWWLADENSREPEPGFTLLTEATEEGEMSESEYADTYKLSLSQMVWRRNKIIEMMGLSVFQREYPATPAEAWTASPGHEPFIPSLHVIRARKHEAVEAVGPLILGVDPASNGGDRFSVAARRGNVVQWVRFRNKIDTLEGTAWLRSIIDECDPARVNIDAGNIGAAIITNLRAIGPRYASLVRAVNFGGTSESKIAKPKVPGPWNRRAEMWMRLRDWLMAPEGAHIPDDPALQTDLCAARLQPRLNNDFTLESKVEMRKRGVRSPDLGDAVALTFAFNEFFTSFSQPVAVPAYGNIPLLHNQQSHDYSVPPVTGGSGWMGAILWLLAITHAASALTSLLHV